ncbi:hypothetical protein BTO20_09710 [Mycobacterium dioxanotrophicus]|uniref:Uncharacterized protein n=1 Tax=Mycobacterium dioxanotrophicus TaxID=482462 RepID=A0A1Y0C0Z2_9MYCO|nr:hypothetical protein BTO20_09710 [Mycobacterium dioxanotrophicus]
MFAVGLVGFATDAASWVDKFGLGRVVAVIVAGACIVTLTGLRNGKPIPWRTPLSAALVVVLVLSGVAFFIFESPPPQTTATPQPPAPPVTTVVVPPDPKKTGCGSDAKETASVPDVEICVVYWCTGAVYSAVTGTTDPTQMQYKIRPRIYNSTDHPVNISINSPTPLRLIVDSPRLSQNWKPPQKTVEVGDSVYPVIRDGKRYWAVPPNAVGDVVQVGGYWSGFSTFWDGDQLEGTGTYFKPLRFDSTGTVIQEGDLVFQLPTNPDGSDPHVLGLAYVTGGGAVPMNIEHLFLKDEHWPNPSQPNSF